MMLQKLDAVGRYERMGMNTRGGYMEGEPVTMDGLLELAHAIGLIREQLVEAQLAGRRVVAGRVATFAVGKVTLEFIGEIKQTGQGPDGLKFLVLTADTKAQLAARAGHKATIELIPQGADGERFVIADASDAAPPG
jgi:hypothetical protein